MKLPKLSIKKLLYNKRFTIPFSILLSFTLWLIITIDQKPIIERTFNDISVNVNLENTFAAENEMSIIGDISEQKFTVVVRGPSYVVSSLTSSDLGLFASAASVDAPGNYNLEVAATASTANAEYQILSISPQTLGVNFDYIETKEFTITAEAVGVTASEGLIAETGVVSGTESDTVTIKGPRTVLNQIETVVASAKVNKTLKSSETFDANIVLLGEDGNEIDASNLTLSTTKVKVTVPISKKKTVPVEVAFTNLPENFDKSSLKTEIDHSTVTIIGTPEMIDKTTKVILSPIDITAVSTSSNSFDVSPKLPDGVRMLDTIEHFTVKINTGGFIEKTFTVTEFKAVGLSVGLKASGAVNIVNVKICGPRAVVNKLNASDIYAQVNLSNLKAGEHTVDALINFKDKTNLWQVGSYKTPITIK